jgi:hypothetical protein
MATGVPDVVFEPKALAEQAVLAVAEKAAALAADKAASEAARRAAVETADIVVARIFLHVGIDVADKDALARLRDNLAFLSRVERGAREIKSAAVKTCVGAVITGLLSLLVLGFLEWVHK